MKRKPVAIIIVLLILIGVAVYYYRQHNSGDSAKATTLYGNVDIRQVSVAFRVAGRVAEVKVDEGAVIRQGDLLANLDAEPLQNAVHIAESTVAALAARNSLFHRGYRAEDIEQARNKVQAAQAALTEAERQYARQRELAGEGASAQRTLEAAESQRDQARAQSKSATEQLRLMTSGFRKEEIAESDAQLSQSRANLDAAKLALRDATLTAPSPGVIITRAVEQGSMVQPGTPAFSLSLTKPVWVRAYVGEAQLGRFPTGARVNLTSDTQSGKIYRGVVGFVSPTAEFTPKTVETTDLRTSLVYRLRIVVENPDQQLRQGMPVTVRLEL